jgi:hypothetical protein
VRTRSVSLVAAASLLGSLLFSSPVAASAPFSNTLLLGSWTPPSGITTQPHANSSGDSEPAIAFGGPNNTMVVDGLAWLPFQVNMWKGHFGDEPPAYFGAMDITIPVKGRGRIGLGSGDADVEVTSAGTILLTDLIFLVNKPFTGFTLGVSVTRCPAAATEPDDCTTTLLDQAGADRQWITVDGTTAYLSYHDSGSSSLVHVLRSTDDGQTWQRVRGPIAGQGSATGAATFNNSQGPIVADPVTHNVYDVYAAGEASVQKGTSADYNNIYVARSTNRGRTWTTHRVFHAPRFTNLANIFPALAVDPSNGRLYASWSDEHTVWVSTSTDQADTWSAPIAVSTATTVVMPWVAARNGKVDVVYYGTNAASIEVDTAVWNVYDSQRVGGAWSIKKVSNTPNRVGAVCLEGSGCSDDRQLLDLFEVALDPVTAKAAVIYTDTTIDTYTTSDGVVHQLPEIVLAYEN